jgi:hypothetical protein
MYYQDLSVHGDHPSDSSFAIWVFHNHEFTYFSWHLDSYTAVLNILAGAAQRFTDEAAASEYIAASLPLFSKAGQGEAGVAEIGRRYEGVPLFFWRGERRLTFEKRGVPSNG